jgi:hypothetical protein
MPGKKSFTAPKSLSVKKGGKVTGMKNCGGHKGRVSQPSTKPHKGNTNP